MWPDILEAFGRAELAGLAPAEAVANAAKITAKPRAVMSPPCYQEHSCPIGTPRISAGFGLVTW
jgi:hypothetical protein